MHVPRATEQGIAWQLAEHRKSIISELSYRYTLDIPASQSEPIEAEAKIDFNYTQSNHTLVLDFLNAEERVHFLSVNGTESDWAADNDHILIPPSELNEGSNFVELKFIAGDEAFNRRENFLYALFVPDRAHFSLPSFDQPNLKGRVSWEVIAPKDWEVVANGPLAESTIEGTKRRHVFSQTKPIPSYLFAVAAGEFKKESTVLNGRTFNMYHRETDSDKVARNTDEIFRLHAASVAWLEGYTQIDYPFQKFDFVLIPSFQYGGMEHPGGILYRQASMFLDETATQNQMLGRASLIAHETAHMWFGDLVTMNWFDDVWTKEVFANFMAAKIVNPSFPEVDHELRFLTAHHPQAYAVDRTQGANAIRQPLENLRFAGTLYGAIIYQKAPIVMRHLENRVGEELFREGMREYLSTFAYGNASWPDLIAILDRRSDEDLSAWSKVWVEEAGRPTVRVERETESISIRQEDPQDRGRLWPQTLAVHAGSADVFESLTIEIGSDVFTSRDLAKAEFILPNGSGLEYGAFILDSASQSYLLAHINDLDAALTRGAAWVTLWDQLLESRLAPAEFLDAALQAFEREQNELILSRVISYTRSIFWNFLSASERIHWSEAIESALWTGTTGNRSRSSRALFYGAYRDLAISESGRARLLRLWQGEDEVEELPLSELDLIALTSNLIIKGVTDNEALLSEQENRIENPDRLARFRFVRDSLSADPTIRAEFFERLSKDSNRDREAWVLDGMSNIHHPLRATEAEDLIYPALSLVSEIQQTGDIFFPGRWLDATLGGHSSIEAAAIVRKFLEDSTELSPRLRLKVLQSADRLFRSVDVLHAETKN